jgi:dethiobiotin synthetase
MSTFFVTGTDTGVGKTWWTTALLQAAGNLGLRTLGLKPVAAGAALTPAGWRNDDALQLQAASNLKLDYEQVNPICLGPPLSPHLAARQVGVSIEVEPLAVQQRGCAAQANFCLIEGAGGWLTPLSDRGTLADLASALAAPVILVVGLKLGCLNHAQLSAAAIRAQGLPLAGWIANEIATDHGDLASQIDFLTALWSQAPLAIASAVTPIAPHMLGQRAHAAVRALLVRD